MPTARVFFSRTIAQDVICLIPEGPWPTRHRTRDRQRGLTEKSRNGVGRRLSKPRLQRLWKARPLKPRASVLPNQLTARRTIARCSIFLPRWYGPATTRATTLTVTGIGANSRDSHRSRPPAEAGWPLSILTI